MTRRRRQDRSSLPHIDTSMLRDQGEHERIDRVWERLERNAALGASSQPSSTGRTPLVAISLAAGFALGISVAGYLWSEKPPAETVVVAPDPDADDGRQVFAAGAAPQTYTLPGGGELTLEPGSIIDTLSREPGMLTLRLLRGEATLSTPAGANQRNGRLSMVIGRAQVTAAGRMQIRHDGDTAFVRVLDGSAEVSAPDADRGMKAMVLGPHEEANVPVRTITASLDRAHQVPSRPRPVEEEPAAIEVADGEPKPIMAVVPAWVEACNSGDYEEAVKLLEKEGGALPQGTDARLLHCIGTGHQALKNTDAAIAVLERVVTELGDDTRAMTAASDLARIYRKRGETDKAAHYEALRQKLSKDSLLTEAALCEKISREAESGNDLAVLRLSARYENQFPDAPCTDKIHQLVAAIQAKGVGPEQQPAAEDGDSGGASPYEGAGDAPAEEEESD